MVTTIAKAKAAKPQPSSHSHAERQAATATRPDQQPCPDIFSGRLKISACMIQPSSHSHAANSKQPQPCSQSQVATATTIAKTTATATARHTKRQPNGNLKRKFLWGPKIWHQNEKTDAQNNETVIKMSSTQIS
jgi:hypothetical protein